MKQLNLLLLTIFLFALQNIKAAETEPNNDRASANTLALNANNTGAIGASGDEDWWKVTTTSDGKLDVTITISNGLHLWCYIYDNDGTTLLSSGYNNSVTTVSKDGLAAGTYYLKLVPYYAGQLPAYTVSNTLTLPAQANDAEPDSTRAQALTLNLNGSTTGHVNYYYNNHRDSVDWYKVTTNKDGLLRLSLTPGRLEHVWIYLYDNDGTTLLNSSYDNAAFNQSTDGLAAGTYYIKIKCYYNNGFAPYTLSDSLFTPAQANDAEPNNTRAQAIVLPLNGSKTGHSNYYYNNQRDTADWYKVTTNADGLLRLSITPGRVENVWIYLYDNDGTTLLNSSYNNGAFSQSTDGLAAGTYYVRINCYYNYKFAPYTLSDSLFTPAQANDAEPNNTRAQAIVLPLNGSKTGHAGYYYNNQRDTADWYKVTTNADGLLRLSITPGRVENVWIYLYDNDGTTLLNSSYNNGAFSQSTDGLAAGTYYVRINCYYNYKFAPYTLSDSLFTYSYAKDQEPNARPYQAKTIPANGASTGHVNFYYNNSRDTLDWWKINYTGSGNLSFTINQEPWKVNGAYHHLYFQVYRDTAVAPIYSNYNIAASWNVNLTALTQGYYWIKVYPYYNYQHVSYSLLDSFTQVNIAAIKATSYDTVASCSSINSVSFSCTKSSAPYTVKLYRYGVLYATKIAKAKNVTFDTLPPGSYYAKAFGDGATGTASGKSKNVNIVPIPTGLSTTSITKTQATLNWTPVACAKFDSIYYRVSGTTTWTRRNTTGNPASFVLTGLAASTTYDWEIAAVDSANGIIATGAFSGIVQFTTPAAFARDGTGEIDAVKAAGAGRLQLITLPNPATSFFIISMKDNTSQRLNAMLFDANGKTVWTSGLINAAALNGKQVNVSTFAKGVFYLKIINENGGIAGSAKVIIAQ